MVLTPRGESLRVPVEETLSRLSGLLKPQVFDPAQAVNRFRIVAPDYVAQSIMPAVLAQVFSLAPKVKIEIVNLSDAAIADLREGRVSLGFGVVDDGPLLDNVRHQALMEDRQVCLMRKDHPVLHTGLTLPRYAASPHALLSITGKGGGRIDDVLRQHGLSRNIVLRVAHFLTVGAVIAKSDLIITIPELLAREVLTEDLVLTELPEELRLPPFTLSQIWHERFTEDPVHQWLRRLIKSQL